MATALQAQLAQISAKSSDPLNLKAHRKAYAQSLLFDPQVAARQSLDTLFDICLEGFNELCTLDPRFRPFAKTIFSEESKAQDRSQLTASQNQELDHVLESFLSLLGPRILLKPALKAFEWLLRHFRVHELNTSCVLYTFLPYHDLPHFVTLLSILPRELPQNFQFLRPYISHRKPPPRHEIVYAAARRISFWREWSVHVLEVCRRGYQYQNMVAYWSGIAAEALASQLEQATRGNRASEQQKTQDVVLNVLPILNDALSLVEVQDVRVSALMLLTLLSSKAALGDETLTKMIEAAVEYSSKETMDAELISVVVLAQRRSSTKLPRRVLRFLVSRKGLCDDIIALGEQYDVGNIATGLMYSAAKNKLKDLAAISPDFLSTLMLRKLITEGQSQSALRDIIKAASQSSDSADEEHKEWLVHTMKAISQEQYSNELLQKALNDTGSSMEQLELSLQTSLRPTFLEPTERTLIDTPMEDGQSPTVPQLLEQLQAGCLDSSFLSPEETPVFRNLYQAFTSNDYSEFIPSMLDSSLFPQNATTYKASILSSFFLRILCGPYPEHTRVSATVCIAECIDMLKESGVGDVQILIPYVLFGLSDPSEAIRKSTIALVAKISSIGDKSSRSQPEPNVMFILGRGHWYGEGRDANLSWLSSSDSRIFIHNILVPNLEECQADEKFVAKVLRHALRSDRSKSLSLSESNLKSSQREHIFAFLLDHISQAPLLSVKMRLIFLMEPIEKVGHVVKSKRMAEVLSAIRDSREDDLATQCAKESIPLRQYLDVVVGLLNSRDHSNLEIMSKTLEERYSEGISTFQLSTLQKIRESWESLKPESTAALAKILFNQSTDVAHTDQDEIRSDAMLETLRQLDLTSLALKGLLEGLSHLRDLKDGEKTPKRRKLDQTRVSSKMRTEVHEALRKATLALELTEHSLQHADHTLIHPLFTMLADLHQIKEADSSVDYTQSLLMDVLNHIIMNTKAADVNRQSLRVDLVVDYFRTSTSTQLQQASLLLMSSLAVVAPDEVIHSIMPVFTFMGSTILRHSDEFSMRVIDKTIDSVIPPLTVSLQKDKRGPLAGVSELILSFVAALEHIAPQRRLDLFSRLVDKIGPDQFLYAFMAMLVDKHGSGKEILDFALELAARYSPGIQMYALENSFQVLQDSLKTKPTMAKHIFSLERYKNYKASASSFSQLLELWISSPQFVASINRILRRDNADSTTIRDGFSKIMNSILQLLNQGVNTALNSRFQVLLKRLLALFPLEESIKALDGLLQNGHDDLRCLALDSLETQVSVQKTTSQGSRIASLGLLHRLHSMLESASSAQVKRATISCIDRIVDKFGKTDPDAVMGTGDVISGANGVASDDLQLRTGSLLCLTSMVEALGDAFVPNVPKTLPLSLDYLQNVKGTSDGLGNAGWAFIDSLFLYVPYIMTGNYLDRILKIAFRDASSRHGKKSSKACLNTVSMIPSQVPAQDCLHALKRTLGAAMTEGPLAVMRHLMLLDATIGRLSKSATVQYSSTITSICLELMDIRRQASDALYTEKDIVTIETALYDVMIKMIYKLNDKYFRPIFAQIVDWANEDSEAGSDSSLTRRISFYGFTAHFFSTLKSIVTNYGSFIIDGAGQLPRETIPEDDMQSLLWARVISTLSAAFEHDQDEFWQAPSRFASVGPPLVQQFDFAMDQNKARDLIQCISLLAGAADSPENLKVINSAVLEKFRHDDAAIRAVAVRCQQSLTEQLGEEWLGQLPEMLPFISEALEDDDERVEMETRRWVGRIEEILGESLDPMLQ